MPKLDWLFWGWLKAFIQYSFVPVVAIAFLMIFEQFVYRYVTTLPPTITSAEYGVYGLQAVAVVVTFCIGIVLVPSLTSSIFSGQGGQSILSVCAALDPHALKETSMPRRFQTPIPDHLREPHEVNVPGLWNVYILGIGIAIALGPRGRRPVDCLAVAGGPHSLTDGRALWARPRQT